MAQPSLSLFEAVTNKDYDILGDLFADNARRSLMKFLTMRNASTSSRVGSPFVAAENEDKYLEFLQQVAGQDSKAEYSAESGLNLPSVAPAADEIEYQTTLRDLGVFLMEGTTGEEDVASTSSSSEGTTSTGAAAAAAAALKECDWADHHNQQPSKKTRQHSQPPVASKPAATRSISSSSVSPQTREYIDHMLWDSASSCSNSRPPSNFVVFHTRGGETTTNDNTNNDEGPPLFDGSVANSTPPPLGGPTAGNSSGAGTILHLACALDLPLPLAFLLAMGADARTCHTAFRRLMIHEAACNGSIQCLNLLLELGQSCADKTAEENAQWQQKMAFSRSNSSPPEATPPFFRDAMMMEQRKRAPADFQRTRGLFALQPYPPTREEPKGDFLHFLGLYREYCGLVKKGFMSELDAARAILSHATLDEASRISLVHSCTFQNSPRNCFARGILRPYGGGCADGHGNTPLHWAAFKNEIDCVSLLLKYNADPNARAHPSGWTPLHDAAYSNSSESIALLIDAGAHVDARANSGATPLCFAAQEDAAAAATLLLERGADLATRCAGGPLARNDDEHGHQHHPHSRFSGYTPLHYCSHYNAHSAAKVLLRHRAAQTAMEIADLSDRLPIHVAVARGSSDVLRELLHAGARVETPRSRNRSLAAYASRRFESFHSEGSNSTITAPSTPTRVVEGHQELATPVRNSPGGSSVSSNSTSVSSPVLRAMIPAQPITSSKPWNCLSQQAIDECKELISHAEKSWAPDRHLLFTPADRRAVLELLRVGKRLELEGTGIFVELWPLVLSFCGRGWFEIEEEEDDDDDDSSVNTSMYSTSGQRLCDEDHLMLPSLER